MTSQCEHIFEVDPNDDQVKCIKCGDLDDEMQLPNMDDVVQMEKEAFDKSQVNFE